MPRCLYCLGWYLSETNELQGSSCECGENVREEDKRDDFNSSRELRGVIQESEDL